MRPPNCGTSFLSAVSTARAESRMPAESSASTWSIAFWKRNRLLLGDTGIESIDGGVVIMLLGIVQLDPALEMGFRRSDFAQVSERGPHRPVSRHQPRRIFVLLGDVEDLARQLARFL